MTEERQHTRTRYKDGDLAAGTKVFFYKLVFPAAIKLDPNMRVLEETHMMETNRIPLLFRKLTTTKHGDFKANKKKLQTLEFVSHSLFAYIGVQGTIRIISSRAHSSDKDDVGDLL